MKKLVFSRMTAMLLTAVMLLGLLPLGALAADVTDFVAAPAGSENLALSAIASASEDAVAAGATPAQINEGDRTWSLWRTAASLEGANDYYELTWDTPVSVDQVVLFNQFSGQAPTAWKVLVSTGNDVWTEVAAVQNVSWTEDQLEGKTVSFTRQNNITGLRVQILDASLIWGGYTVYEIEVYNSGDADDNAVIAEDFVKVPDGFANHALTASVSTSSDVVLSGDLAQINDGDRTWAVSRTGSMGEDCYDFTWSEPVSVNQVVLFNQYSGQAPTAWKIFVTTDGSQWNEVAVTENVSWTESDLQGKVLKFQQQENVVGLRVQITNANMDWGHYCIYEVEIYDTADVEKEGYALYWNDEFNGTELDSTKWLNQYLPHATASENGAMTDYEMVDGVLTLKIDEDHPTFYDIESEQGFKVSSIQTYEKNWLHDVNAKNVDVFDGFRTQYGYFEVRYKMPSCGGGGHVAFWMVGTQADARADGRGSQQNSEIDVTETKFSSPNSYTPRIYGQDDPDMVNWSTAVELEGDYVNQWHTYAVDWTPDYIVFFVDGVEVARSEQSPQYEMCLLLGMYINDDANDEAYWGGMANDVYPKEWEIDYVRVYKSNDGYENGVTKPAQPDLLEGAVAVTNPAVSAGMENKAFTANVITSGDVVLSDAAELVYINNGDKENSLTRLVTDLSDKTDFYQFNWETPVSVNQVVLYNQYAGQAPVAWEIFVTTDGQQWNKVAVTDNVLWSDDQLEGKTLTFTRQENIIGLRVQIVKANLDWGHYCIYEVEIYDTHSAVEFPNLFENCNPGFDGALDENSMPELWTVQGNGSCGSYDNYGDMVTYLWKPAGGESFGMRSSRIPVVPGEQYYIEMLVNGTGNACFYVEFWNAAGEQCETYYVTTRTLSENSWDGIGGSFTAPADAAYMGIQIRTEGEGEETIRFDDLYACVHTENYALSQLKRALEADDYAWTRNILSNPPCAFQNVNEDSWTDYYLALKEVAIEKLSFAMVQQVIDQVNSQGSGADVLSWNLTLGDNVGMNFLVRVDANFVDQTYVNITVGGAEAVSYKVSDYTPDENGNYLFSANVAAAQMTEEVKLQTFVGDEPGEIHIYTAEQYVATVLADDSMSNYHALVKEMLNYGAAAQNYFGYEAKEIDAALYVGAGTADISAEGVEDMVVTDKVDGISFYGATLLFRSKTAVRFYFTTDGNIAEYTFKLGDQILTAGEKNGMYYVDVEDINPQDLDEMLTLTVFGDDQTMTVAYGPMNYMVRMNEKGSESLKALLKAMYNYYLAAEAM